MPDVDVARPGPDLVIAGAARSGTSMLAAQLGRHPQIDPGSVKEPNYFSREYDRGQQWYEGLFGDRAPQLLRLDASASYTYPYYPQALERLATASPHAFVVYIVRNPIERAVSHYLFYRHYFGKERAPDFGSALRQSSYYTDVSDYARWVPLLLKAFPDDRVLVVPFEALTRSSHSVASVVYRQLQLPPPPLDGKQASGHQNNVVEFRTETARLATRAIRRSRFYPAVRSAVGAERMRSIRSVLTRRPEMPSNEEALASCDKEQLADLRALDARARSVVLDRLVSQDDRLTLAWARHWASERPA